MNGVLAGFLAVFSYAVLKIMDRKGMVDGIPPFLFIAVSMTVLAGLAAIGHVLTVKGPIFALTTQQWGMLVVYGFLNLIGFTLVLVALKSMPVTEYQIIGITTPICVAFLAAIFLKEPILIKHMVGAVIVGLGIFIAIR